MAEPRRIVTATAGTTGRRGKATGDALKVDYTSSGASCGASVRGSGRVSFGPYLGRPRDTGFTANQRPALYYRPGLDQVDNPHLGLLLSDGFVSQSKLHYRPPRTQTDRPGSWPNVIDKTGGSGFHQLKSREKTATDEQKSEYQRFCVPRPVAPSVSLKHITMGPQRETGFTEGAALQLISFQEKNSSRLQPRQTRGSAMKGDFLPPSSLQGAEAIPGLRSHCCRETGFTRGAAAPLACPTSVSLPPQSNNMEPRVKTVGKKEPTGYVLNAPNGPIFPTTPFDGLHFTTHYRSTFCHDVGVEKWRCGHTGAGIISAKMDNGYNRRDMDRFIFRG